MKLKTKFQDEDFELGEVVNANIYYGGSDRIKIVATSKRGGEHSFYYESLKELGEMFEDVPKEEVWYLGKRIGNYSMPKKEADIATEKILAWKRLKEAGFKFTDFGYNLDETSSSLIGADGKICFELMCYEDFAEDLDLLFGGENE